MNPDPSSNNSANVRFMNPPPNPGSTGMYSPNNPQFRPRMEQMYSGGRMESNSNQPNYQQQNNPQQYQQMQQNNQRMHPSLVQQGSQQNIRFSTNEDLVRSQTNPNYNSNLQQKSPGVPFDGQRMQMAPPNRFPNPQQPVRYPYNNQSGGVPFNQPNLQNQPLKTEPPKAPQPNLQNFSPDKAQINNGPSANTGMRPSVLETNSSNILNTPQTSRENASKSPTSIQPEKKPDTINEGDVSKSEEPDQSYESNESEDYDSENDEKVLEADTETKKKDEKEIRKSIIKDDGIISGMVQKNIKFFEQNDTAKTPLRPKTLIAEKKEKTKKVPSNVIKSDSNKDEFESGVDETPVVHPNLGSIYQVPRKVAKIPFSKENKRSRKYKTKRYFEETLNRKRSYGRLTFSQFLKPPFSYSYKPGGSKKTQFKKTYGPEEELLSFFENTKSWRKLSRYGSKANENAAKDKVVHRPTTNGDIPTPKKTPSKLQTPSKKNPPPASPVKTPLKSPGTPGTPGAKLLPKTPESPAPPTPLIKKVPMNKIQVGAAPSPNLKTIKSKVGSLANTTHKPGGGNIKIESHKIDLSNVQPRTEAKNDQYKPSGGDKKIQQVKLQWSAKSKVGSLENATYKPGGGDKKIESVKLDFKEKAKSKVGSKDNVKHVPGGGNVKIENQKLEFKAQSKVGSLDNVKHKPGGGDIKIFDDKTYLRQVSGNSSEGRASGTQAYKNLSVEQELRTRSAPGTPGRKTSIKLKKTTSIENSEEAPKIKKITEVIVTSQTPKTNGEIENSPTKVKVTYSKMSSLKSEGVEGGVELIKTPAKPNAPVLKPSLREKDIINDSETGKQNNRNENRLNFENTAGNKNVKNSEMFKTSPESPNLLQGKSNMRDDSRELKFIQGETETQQKIGEIWRERNATDKSELLNNRQQFETSYSHNLKTGNTQQQVGSLNPNIKTENQTNEFQRNLYPNQNLQYEQLSQNPSFPQNQQRPPLNSSLREEYRISGSQQNQPFTNNPQFWQNPPK